MSALEPCLEDLPAGTRSDGRYTVHGVLGRGAQAVVYDGTHDELARAVAIKVLDMSWAGESAAISRFFGSGVAGLGLAFERNREEAKALAAYRRYLGLATRGPQREAVRKRIRMLE